MKTLLTFVCFTLLSTQCVSKKATNKQVDPNAKEVVFIYKYYTRGFYKEHHMNQEKIKTFLDYSKTKFTEKDVIPMDWTNALDLLTKIDLKEFENLEAPSSLRHTDRVQHGELTIKINNTTFRSRNFDHGNPPKKIKSIVAQLLSMSEND
ncbi:MAG: hypothetical protein P8H23_02900 [Flavobacteriaceae bacterium]|nr:hypothetical protein [Flavobacteriaceae bacterium]